MTARTDDLVRAYLDRLGAAAAVLPPDRRADLLDGIAEHIDAARAAGAAADEAAVRTLLDRLGSPEEIVAAAREDGAGVVLRPRGTGRELAAVLLLTAGSFVPVVGWVAGVVLLWSSPLWRVREKLLGTLVWPLGPGGFLVGGAFVFSRFGTQQTCVQAFEQGGTLCTTEAGTIGWPVTLLWLVPPVVVAVVLHRTAVRRARALPPEPVAAGAPAPWGVQEVAGVLLLGLGGLLLPVVPAVVGLALVLTSRRWLRREKVVGGLLAGTPLLLAVAGAAGYYLSNGAFAVGPLELGLLGGYLTLLLGPVVSAVYLSVVLSRRA